VSLTDEDRKRYHRHMLISGWERRARRSEGLTCLHRRRGWTWFAASMYLAAAGVGHIAICDFDCPDLSNLNRQILHNDSRIGMNKAESAKLTLSALNPSIDITAVTTRIEPGNVDDLVGESRHHRGLHGQLPDPLRPQRVRHAQRHPLRARGIWGLEGRVTFIRPPETPCLQCIFPAAPPKEVFPVLGAVPGVIGCLQATETLKYLTGVGENLKGKALCLARRRHGVRAVSHCQKPEVPRMRDAGG